MVVCLFVFVTEVPECSPWCWRIVKATQTVQMYGHCEQQPEREGDPTSSEAHKNYFSMGEDEAGEGEAGKYTATLFNDDKLGEFS